MNSPTPSHGLKRGLYLFPARRAARQKPCAARAPVISSQPPPRASRRALDCACHAAPGKARLAILDSPSSLLASGPDGFGRRHLRRELQQVNGAWLAGNTCYYVYAGWNVIREEHTWGNVDYTHGLELLSRRSSVAGEPAIYYETDANGNIVLLVNEQGQVAGRYEYDPYGNLVQLSGRMADVNRYRYSGKEYDPRVRLYCTGER